MKMNIPNSMNHINGIKKSIKKLRSRLTKLYSQLENISKHINYCQKSHDVNDVARTSHYQKLHSTIDKVTNTLNETIILCNVQIATIYEEIRQDLSDDIQAAREEGDIECLVYEFQLPASVMRDLEKKDNVIVKFRRSYFIFPETTIYIQFNESED